MGLLSKITRLRRESKVPPKSEIHDYQFLDKNGRYHMTEYLSYYEKEDSFETFAQDTGISDSFISSFFAAPSYEAQKSWEQYHGPKCYKGGLKNYSVSSGIRRIGRQAFAYNLNLTSVQLPDGLEEIDKEAFAMCESLMALTVPSSVVFIGRDAFDTNMEELVLMGSMPPEISTLGVSAKCRIIVPMNCKEHYCKNRHWRRYKGQIKEQ